MLLSFAMTGRLAVASTQRQEISLDFSRATTKYRQDFARKGGAARDADREVACEVLADVRTLTGLQRDAEGAEGGVGEEGY